MKKLRCSLCMAIIFAILLGMFPHFSIETHANELESTSLPVWDGTVSESFAGGTGTEEDPYQIARAEQLALLADEIMKNDGVQYKHYILINDIYLNDSSEYATWDTVVPTNSWTPMSKFKGVFDGNNHSIYGLYINSDCDNVGLFSELYEATVKNVTIAESYVRGNNNVGAVCGLSTWYSKISGCANKGIVHGNKQVGGIVGATYVTEEDCYDCYNSGAVTGVDTVGGILGAHTGGENGYHTIVARCYNTGNITGQKAISGIVGDVYNYGVGRSYVNDCYNAGIITCTESKVGGIVAQLSPNRVVNRCYNVGQIVSHESDKNVGAIIGCREVRSGISNCYYLKSTCVRGSYSPWFGEEILSPLTESQMKDPAFFSGFDFTNIWCLDGGTDYPYPELISQDTRMYAPLQIVDSITNEEISDFTIRIEGEGLHTILKDDGMNASAYVVGAKATFSNTIPILIYADGYRGTMCYSDELKIHYRSLSGSDNYIFMTPIDASGSLTDIEEQLFILEHVNFVNEDFARIIQTKSFANAYWQFDNGDSLLGQTIISWLGNVNDVLSFEWDQIQYATDYYDLYLADLIMIMTGTVETSSIHTVGFDNYGILLELDKRADGMAERWVREYQNLGELIEDEALLDQWKSVNQTVQNNGGWTIVKEELMQKFLDKDFDLCAGTEAMLDCMTPDFFMKTDLLNSVFSGGKIAEKILGSINSTSDAREGLQHSTQAYIIASIHADIINNIFSELDQTIDEIDDHIKANKFKKALQKYKDTTYSIEELYDYCQKELDYQTVEFILELFVKDICFDFVCDRISNVTGIPVSTLQSAIFLYQFGYSILDWVTGMDEKAEQYHIMYYVAPVEAALQKVVNNHAQTLLNAQTYENALNFDYAYRALAATNQCLFRCIYAYGASEESIANMGRIPEVMEYGAKMIYDWQQLVCHGNNIVITDYKYTSVQCPVDIYVYDAQGNILVSVVNEEIVEYDPSILLLNYNEKKSLVYPANEDYTIKIVAREEGTMDYYVSEIREEKTRNIEFYSIPLTDEKIYTGNIPSAFDVERMEYALTADEEIVGADYDTNKNEYCLETPSDLLWQSANATWSKIEGAKQYKFYLYKDGQQALSVITENNYYDCSGVFEETGDYTFCVIAIGDGTEYQNSRRSTRSGVMKFRKINGVDAEENLVYNGTPQIGYTGTPTSKYEGIYEITYTGRNNTYNSSVAPTNAGEYTVTFKIPDGDSLYSSDLSVNFTIDKAQVTVTADDKEVYIGDSMPELTYKVDGLIDGDTISIELSCDVNIDRAGEYPIIVSATDPNGNYEITTVDGTMGVKDSPNTPNVPPNPTYPPVVSEADGGKVTVTPKNPEKGDTVIITPVPDSGMEVDEITVTDANCSPVNVVDNGDGSYSFIQPDTSVTIEVTFKETALEEDSSFDYDHWYWSLMMLLNQEYKITATATDGGTINPDGTSKVKYDKNITYTITPDEGYAIADVLVDGKSVGAISKYTFKRVKEKHTIEAVFKEIQWQNPFNDVSENDWFYKDIEYVYKNGLMLGTNTEGTIFSPDAILNRAMLVTILWRLEGEPVVDYLMQFEDVAEDEWYTEAIRWAAANGIVLGYDGKFNPTDALSREQTAAILHRYAVLKGWDNGITQPMIPQYEYSDWAENDVIWTDMNGIFDDIGVDTYDLTESVTRAEVAAYLRRFCENIAE